MYRTAIALERLGQHGTFKSRALWSVRDGKGLINCESSAFVGVLYVETIQYFVVFRLQFEISLHIQACLSVSQFNYRILSTANVKIR
jgi:hypothetical protein